MASNIIEQGAGGISFSAEEGDPETGPGRAGLSKSSLAWVPASPEKVGVASHIIQESGGGIPSSLRKVEVSPPSHPHMVHKLQYSNVSGGGIIISLRKVEVPSPSHSRK